MFGISDCTMHNLVKEMAQLIVKAFPHAIRLPNSHDEIRDLSSNWSRFNYLTGIVAALDGCHILISLPAGGKSEEYYNFKGWYSLLGLFILAMNIEYLGSMDDSTILKESYFWNYITQLPKNLYFIGDGGFVIHKKLMIPYNAVQLFDNRVNRVAMESFKYLLSRVRVRVEQTFGILKKKWRFLNREMSVDPELHVLITKAICTIHYLSINCNGLDIVSWSSVDVIDLEESEDLRMLREWEILSQFVCELGPLVMADDETVRREGQCQRAQYLSSLVIAQ